MNYYLFAVECMAGVIAMLGFFSLLIYLSGFVLGRGKTTAEKEEESQSNAGANEEEELKKVAAIAAVVAYSMVAEKAPAPSIIGKPLAVRAERRTLSAWLMGARE
jgi:Na+-transporting methylmalonyl-CoA/oxaloacetate decarboxylase gamma subunit